MTRIRLAVLLSWLGIVVPAFAGNPANDQLEFTGASLPGLNTLTFANNVYSFAYTGGDENLTYQVDLADPKVAGGQLRIHELSSDSWPIDGGGIAFRDSAGTFFYPNTNYKTSVLTSHSKSGNVLTLNYTLTLNGTHTFRYEIRPAGKQLRIRCTDPSGSVVASNNLCGVAFGKSTGVETPVPIRMQGALSLPITMFRHVTASGTEHWFTANILDQFQSNGSDYRLGGLISPVIGPDSTTYGMDTATRYDALSNGKLAAPLDDTLVLIVSSRIRDVLVESTAPPSPYRNLLANRMVFNAPSSLWESYDKMFDLYLSLGMYSLAGYFFLDWTNSAVDPPSPASVGPDWSPAYDPGNFSTMLHDGLAMGALLGAYTSFNCMPDTAPASVYDASHIVKDANGNEKTYTGLGFPLIGVEAAGLHAASETAKLKTAGANVVYLDIQTYGSISKGPDGGHLDQTATSPWAKTMRQGYIAQKTWFEGMRDTLEGPLLGEGSIATSNANMEYLYTGYVDSVQRCVNPGGGGYASTKPAGALDAPTNWPIIPEYEWHVAARKQINHGNGFYERFFGPSDGLGVVQNDGLPIYPLTQEAMDLYEAFLISYGHSGFISTNGAKYATEGYVTHASAAQTYFMTNALQVRYFATPVTAISYRYQNAWQSFEDIVFETETLDTFRHVPLRIDFESGLRIYVNHGSTPLTITELGMNVTLPARSGWFANQGSVFVAFSAIPPGTSGKRIDYCKAPGQYEYFNGRGEVSGYGGISTTAKRSKWTVTATNLTVTEDSTGKLTPSLGLPPQFLGIQILADDTDLQPGDRTGLKAIAVFANGGLLEVTTLLEWSSVKPGVASVSQAGIVKAKTPGVATIIALVPPGLIMSAPLVVTVH